MVWTIVRKMCITLCISKGEIKMTIYSCKTHINQALDVFVAETETFPILEELPEEKKLSTKCDYCEEQALYIVANV